MIYCFWLNMKQLKSLKINLKTLAKLLLSKIMSEKTIIIIFNFFRFYKNKLF